MAVHCGGALLEAKSSSPIRTLQPPTGNTLHRMTAAQAVILVAGSLVLLTAMIALMIRANNRETAIMQRRCDEWIANGSHPDEEPNFFTGSSGSQGGAY